MRLKTYCAGSMAEAMDLVRQALGDEAIIVSSQGSDESGSVRVTAAIEAVDDVPSSDANGGGDRGDTIDLICTALDRHGVPDSLTERLMGVAAGRAADQPLVALAAAFDALFTFAPLPTGPAPRPLFLVGPPGGGKTVSLAKLATRAVLAHQPVRLVTTDTTRAGAIHQLDTYARALRLELTTADDPPSLTKSLVPNGNHLALIDSPGVNPYDASELSRLRELIEAAGAEPVLVLAAGGDPSESAEVAEIFTDLGVRRVLMTRLDAVLRLGNVLAVAAGSLSLSEAGITPHIALGLEPINPFALARLFLAKGPMERRAADDEESTLHLNLNQAVQ